MRDMRVTPLKPAIALLAQLFLLALLFVVSLLRCCHITHTHTPLSLIPTYQPIHSYDSSTPLPSTYSGARCCVILLVAIAVDCGLVQVVVSS
jgi:hypothetical protein